jgi:hypothetical protein
MLHLHRGRRISFQQPGRAGRGAGVWRGIQRSLACRSIIGWMWVEGLKSRSVMSQCNEPMRSITSSTNND